ncbi:MAG: tyrosine-type recombinase/integrase [Lentisphaerae bacterium]|nr:tyrosine-type recombinase/integrase [Lentisphaerota bacterium]
MADTRYLQKRRGVWYIRVARPPKSWGLGGREFLHSLKTPELKHAQKLRDRYLLPILAEDSALRMVEQVALILGRAGPDLQERLKELGVVLGEDQALTLETLSEKFLRSAERADYKPSTVKAFRSTLTAFQRILGPDTEVHTLGKGDLLRFRDALTTLPASWMSRSTPDLSPATKGEKAVSPRTIEGFLRRLSRVFAWAIDEDLFVGKNPLSGVKLTFTRRQSKQELTTSEADLLLTMPYPRNKNIDRVAWQYMPVIARYTGARLAEIGQLRRDDVVSREGTLSLSIDTTGGRTVKTESSVRFVPVSDKLRPHLEKLLSVVKSGRLFSHCGDWQDKNGYTQVAHGFKLWNRHAKKVGAHISFHSWRHYAVTQMANAGVAEIDRMRIVGHAVSGTHAVYTAENLQRYKDAVDRIP